MQPEHLLTLSSDEIQEMFLQDQRQKEDTAMMQKQYRMPCLMFLSLTVCLPALFHHQQDNEEWKEVYEVRNCGFTIC